MFERFRRDGGTATVPEREEEADRTVVAPPREEEADRTATVPEREEEADHTVVAPPREEADHTLVAPSREERVAEEEAVEEHDESRFRRTPDDERLRTPVEPEPRTLGPVVAEETVVAMHDRQRLRFGGFAWGSAFFGLLSAIGLAAILLGIVAAAGVAIGVSEINDVRNGDADTIGLGGAILVLAALGLSWFCGGYVAGRMARFDGARQGLAVWLWTVAVGVVLAIAALIGGSDYDVFAQLNLPNVAVGDQTLTTGGAITLAAALVVTLVFAVAGGKFGDRFHRRVDRFAAREYVEDID
jgi:hypothetical protein